MTEISCYIERDKTFRKILNIKYFVERLKKRNFLQLAASAYIFIILLYAIKDKGYQLVVHPKHTPDDSPEMHYTFHFFRGSFHS